MKKTVLLLTLSFFVVSFLNAQSDQQKTIKTRAVEDVYMDDGFMRLMEKSPEEPNVYPVYNLHLQRVGNQIFSFYRGRRDLFSSHGSILCCLPPSDKILSHAVKAN